MKLNNPKPLTIRDKTYASLSEAARALGVTRRAIQLAIQRGSLQRVGLKK